MEGTEPHTGEVGTSVPAIRWSHRPIMLPLLQHHLEGTRACVCRHRSGSGLGLTLHCPAQPGDSEQRSYKDIDFPPSLPERDQMSSRSDTSLTFQWGFLVCLYPVFLFFLFFKDWVSNCVSFFGHMHLPGSGPPKQGGHALVICACRLLTGHPGLKECQGVRNWRGGGINCQENTRLCCDSDSINYHYLSVQVCQPSPRFGPA